MTDTATPASTTTVSATPSSATTTSTVKPGWKTSEYWLTKGSLLLSVLVTADVIPVGGTWNKAVLCATLLLGSAGYHVGRMLVKNAAVNS